MNTHHPLRRWSPYLLPNILTSLNLMAGFYAITLVLAGRYRTAVWLILVAAVMDGLDGMAARLTRGSSAFGLEFDSLADLVSFGLAPSLLVYQWILRPYGRIGWVAAFLFLACGALRLARFNVQSLDVQRFRFLGIPIPMAAMQLVTTYMMVDRLKLPKPTAGILVVVTTILAAFLMISTIPYRSLKAVRIPKRYSFYVPVLFMLLAGTVWIYPHRLLWILSTCYILSGPVELVLARFLGLNRKPPLDGEQAARETGGNTP